MLDQRIKKWIEENDDFISKVTSKAYEEESPYPLLEIKKKMYEDIPNAFEDKLWNNIIDNYGEFYRLVSIQKLEEKK